MTDKETTEGSGRHLTSTNEDGGSADAAREIERLRADLARCRAALESIRDQTFEPTNSPRLVDQLWHFVRWSKATARGALDDKGETESE